MAKGSKKPDAERLEEQADLTEALEETFPASDPLSMTQPHGGHDSHRRDHRSATGTEAELDRQRTGARKSPHRGRS